jgi:DNA-binding NarL/FixJ family response regulator
MSETMDRTDKFRLLVVDDEDSILKMFGEIFEALNEESKNVSELQKIEAELFSNAVRAVNTQYSYALTYCKQGEEAVEEVRHSIENDEPYSCVFLDMRMPPGKNGLWTAEKIRSLDPDVNIVIVTGYTDVTPAELNEKVPPTNRLLYLKKPIKPQEVRQFADYLTKNWLENKKVKKVIDSLQSKVLKSEIKELAYNINNPEDGMSEDMHVLKINKLQDTLYNLKKNLKEELEKLSEANALLKKQEKEIEESKIALKVVLKNRVYEEDVDHKIKDLNKQIMFNILEIAEPYIEKLENSGLNKIQQEYLAILKKNLHKLTGPGVNQLSNGEYNFSNTEAKIINLIKHGKSSKQIALLFNISPRTVEYHRNNIRKKLGLAGSKGTNLNTYLRTFDL